uniref:Uncharacterized protein n=1 Tax=Theropithecus gelada TaxID=9565 RepID=A0A8D2E5T5_THEGE
MSGYQASHSNTDGRLGHPKNTSFPARIPGWTKCTLPNEAKSLKCLHTQRGSGSESSSCSSCSEQPFNPSPTRLPLGRICMGRPCYSKYTETSHLVSPKVARKPAFHGSPCCLLCRDCPSDSSSPTFLDQLIQGINYLDRFPNACNSCHKTLQSLPKLAANYLERAASSLNLDHQDHPLPQSYSRSYTCMVLSLRGASALQCLDDSANMSYPCRSHCKNFTTVLPRGPRTKLPELPLLGNGLFALGCLPKVWEAICSGWCAPEPISKPPSWW